MKVIRDGIQLCEECLMVAVNGDASGLDYSYKHEEAKARLEAIVSGLEALGPNLVPAFDSETEEGIREHATCPCDCCGTKLHGSRHTFATLGE